MNVDTLLEAAKYLEEQEEKAKQQRQVQLQIPTNTLETAIRVPTIVQQNHVQFAQQHIQQQPPQVQQQQQPQVIHQQNLTPSLMRTVKTLDHTSPPALIPTTAPHPPPPTRIIKNSFDIINRLVIDETGEQKRKPPPIVFRAGTREVHNKLEKDRRAHLKECFDLLKKQLPKAQDERKSSNLSILHAAIRYITNLKKRERDLEHEMEQLARQKIAYQQKMAVLKRDLCGYEGMMDFGAFSPDVSGQGSSVQSFEDAMEASPPVHIPFTDEIKIEPTAVMAEDQVLVENAIVKGIESIPKSLLAQAHQMNGVKENAQLHTTALSVVPLSYPMSQVVLQKVALVPKNLTDLSPLVPSPTVAHLITPQQIGGKVLPIMNAQYVMKPVVVVSTASRPS